MYPINHLVTGIRYCILNKDMKQLLLIALLILSISSCCRTAIPIQSEVSDNVREEKSAEIKEILRDTTIYIYLPDQRKETTTQAVDSFLETNAATSTARINEDGSLFHSIENKPGPVMSVTIPIKDTRIVYIDKTLSNRSEYKEVPVKMPLSAWEKFFLWSGAALWLLVIGFIVLRFLRK